MNGQYVYTPYIWPMLASTFVSAALAVYTWRHRAVPGATALTIQALFVALWGLFTAAEIAAVTVPTKIVYHKVEAVAGIVSVCAMFYFALERAGANKWATRRTALLLASVTTGILLLAATNDLHHLVWTGFWFDRFLHVARGPLNPLIIAWVLLLPTAAILLFLRLLLRSAGIYRLQALILFAGAALPMFTLALELAGIDPIAPLDPVIIMWTVSGVLYALAIFRFHLLEAVPIGRDMAIERLANGVLILDAQDRIVDVNPAAAHMLALARRAAIGRPASQILGAHPDLLRWLQQNDDTSAEITLAQDGQPRRFQAQAFPLTHPGGFHLGRLLLFQDVTEQHQAKLRQEQTQRSLATLQERERLAREMHDSLGQTLAAAHLQAGTARVLLAQGATAQMDECLKQMADMTLAAEADVREYLLGAKTVFSAECPFFESLRQYVTRFSQKYGLRVELSVPPRLEAQGLGQQIEVQFTRIIQEALSNVRKHARAQNVQVAFTVMDSRVAIAITDDGQGFDPAAVTARQVEGFGLQAMRERAETLGGSLELLSQPGLGTKVIVHAPIQGEAGLGEVIQ